MNKNMQGRNYFYIALLMPALFLPGCGFVDWLKNKFGGQRNIEQSIMNNVAIDDSSEVLVMINGKPAITVKSFERDFEMLMEENPQLKSVLPFMPDARRNFLVGLKNQEIVDRFVCDNGLDQKAEYKQELERLQRSVVRMLNTKFFTAAHPVAVDEAEIAAYYDANKDKMQELVISRGGMQTMGVQFEKEADAQAFMKKVQGKNMAEVAQAEKLGDKMRDFKLVNKQSVGIEPVLRNHIVAMEKLPATDMVKVDKAWWVVQVTAKEDAKYRAFDEVKEPLRALVEREKSNEALQKAIDGLEREMKVVVNIDYFKAQESEQPDLAAMLQAQGGAEPQEAQPAAVAQQQREVAQPARAV